MNQDQNHKSSFEDRLLAKLRATVATRRAASELETEAPSGAPAWRRAPRLALAAAAVTAVAAAALIVSAGGDDTSAAYAVNPHGDGTVGVEIRSLSNPGGLEEALDEAGVPAKVDYEEEGQIKPVPAGESVPASETVPASEVCTAPEATSSDGAGPVTGTTGSVEATRLTISPEAVGPGQTLVLTAAPSANGEGNDVRALVEGEAKAADGEAAIATVEAFEVVECESSATSADVPSESAQKTDDATTDAGH